MTYRLQGLENLIHVLWMNTLDDLVNGFSGIAAVQRMLLAILTVKFSMATRTLARDLVVSL